MQPTKLLNKNFVLLFQGQLVSQVGTSVYLIAIIFWIKHATGSATIVGLVAMVAMIPSILLGPFGGTFAYSPTPVAALFILMFVGACSGLVSVLVTSVIQLSTPSEIRGRVFGLLGTLSTGLAPISLGLAGVIADLVDHNIPLIYIVSGACLILLMPLLIFSESFHQLMAYVGSGDPGIEKSPAD